MGGNVLLNKDKLEELNILDWQDYKSNFAKANLLLGNGFSVNFSKVFNYDSLFKVFLKKIDSKHKDIFNQFGTSNFETIQETLLNAKKVNKMFGLSTKEISEYIIKLQEGLILTIEESHPRKIDIDWDKLNEISIILDSFEDIFTLNYDLFLYYMILISKDRYKENKLIKPYQDYFWESYNSNFLQFMDYQNYKHYKHVYYLHGALFLFKNSSNALKLKNNSVSGLIETISKEIKSGNIPLFVSEGTAEDKTNIITRNNYLSFANDKFKEEYPILAIYGTSLSDQDKHIINAINKSKKKIAYFIYVGNKTIDKLKSEIYLIKSKLSIHDIKIFDSVSLFDYHNI